MTEVRDVARAGLSVEATLADFIEAEALPGTGVTPADFWQILDDLNAKFGPETATVLARRADLQSKLDGWYASRRGVAHDPVATRAFLTETGYLVPASDGVQVSTTNVEPEIAAMAGPQLVVPATIARYVINAANARWGSLYDALYGTDALGDTAPAGPYDPNRGARVTAWARAHLDKVAPLATGSWADLVALSCAEGGFTLSLPGGQSTELAEPAQYVGYTGSAISPTAVVLRVNGLHLMLKIDPDSPVGRADALGIADIELEAALTTIVDLEDSVACVDGPDKAVAYRTWLGLMKGDLSTQVTKGGKTFTRSMTRDRQITAANGAPRVLRGRSLLLVRNVGHLMTTPAVHDAKGAEISEGLLDALVSVTIALHDLRRDGGPVNAPAGSVYVVKPKLHGPDEVALTDALFTAVEQALGLPVNTVKLGIMDEERRTSATLDACIAAAKHRVAFINTGFLDRTGDEIRTASEAGPMLPKTQMKTAPWLDAYERRNVLAALDMGLKGRAQIGKGMWAMPDKMADMLDQKIGHPLAGATTAWVPSPTASTLHATHYHQVDVFARLDEIAAEGQTADALLDVLLTPPTLTTWPDAATVASELDNNAQGILGYVVRWVDQGIGCSKVPDIHGVGLMEDRATCRISSQAIANWLLHGVIDEAQALDALRRMAVVVDQQNADDPSYQPMAPGYDGAAFQAACDLVFRGGDWPSGYTEPALHKRRLEVKALGGT